MTFEEFLNRVKEIPCHEKRAFEADYVELVVSKVVLDPVNVLLESYFGKPFKPAGSQPSAEANGFAKPYGGINVDQTLFARKAADHTELAFLWPWGNGTHVTLKLFFKAKV